MILKNNFNFLVFNNLPFGIIISDKIGDELYINDSAKAILNIELQTFIDENCIRLLLKKINEDKNNNVETSTTEININGTFYEVIVLYKSKYDEAQISLIKSMEEELFQYKNLASMGTMISGIAHELNNPMAGISMSYQMAEKIIEQFKEYISNNSAEQIDKNFINNKLDLISNELQDIKTNVVKSSKLVGDLLNFSKKERLDLSLHYLKEIIEDVVRFGSNQTIFKLANIQIDCPSNIKLCCDKLKIQQAIYNLVKNAVESITNNHEIKILCREKNSLIEINIVDNGSGIPKELIGQVFNPFFTTKGMKGGTGLGLSISQRLIERHGGKINLDSTLQKGTTFKITLPNNLE